ncbi:MAG: hypothetical protein COU22_00395 [Candidatus Komeilibacteria bacterium CG10_big_fil_rev_8_21_14_0_10_41_13]|uniref:Uncharacterized protein n=1 Tax=Candidatus Komeilibacteria bacterium CG10_big_fil_rev_8_21_14_0_10_41_13 TaxID=1974476 RepID=A0A2M6WD99_9BACT|nr:MAG: hypothetical protein COU22_00395 [Candidatus Komeilibacteria bacterium CG10_big_fil_rev_8_21_14_0_10_41_13]
MAKSKITLLIIIISFCFLALPLISQAGILPACAIGNQDGSLGNRACGLCDIVQTAVNIFRFILGILGGAALLMFVWHGFNFLTSQGNKERVEAAKKGLVHTIIGIVIVLFSWFIVNFIIVVATSDPAATQSIGTATIFGKGWANFCN